MRRLLVGLAASLVVGAVEPASSEAVDREIEVDGARRSYLLHVPPGWDRTRAIPVLFVFHGAGSDPESMVAATGFDAMAAQTPMVVVYPRAPRATKRYDVDPPAGRESADVRLFDALLDRLRARFAIDPSRVFATGFSNGAALCYRLAAERPHVVAAVAPVAGYLPRLGSPAAAVPVPVLHVHGTADGRVGGPAASVAAWAQRSGAGSGPDVGAVSQTGGLVLRRSRFRGPTPRADVDLLLVEGEGHVWSGGPGGPVSRAILEFLMSHPRSASTPPAPPPGPLVGTPFGSTSALRWLTPDGSPVSVADRPLTLFRWWTNGCAHCTGSVPALARLEDRYRARGLRLVAVYHPKGAPLSDVAARDSARRLGFEGAIAFDDRWSKYLELRDRGDLRAATSVSVLVDRDGVIRWVHPGPRIEEGSPDLAALDAFLDAALPRATPPSR